MTIHARSEHARGSAAVRRLRERARRYLAQLGREDAELSVLVVDDAAMRVLNRSWRGRDRATDVLSFPSAGPEFAHVLGDVVISLDTAERVAREEGTPVGEELDRYLAHGILHLLGHDHTKRAMARAMAAAEDALVARGLVSTACAPGTAPGAAPQGSRAARASQANETGPGHGHRSAGRAGAGHRRAGARRRRTR